MFVSSRMFLELTISLNSLYNVSYKYMNIIVLRSLQPNCDWNKYRAIIVPTLAPFRMNSETLWHVSIQFDMYIQWEIVNSLSPERCSIIFKYVFLKHFVVGEI